jgi:hypothetical protein
MFTPEMKVLSERLLLTLTTPVSRVLFIEPLQNRTATEDTGHHRADGDGDDGSYSVPRAVQI